MVQEEVKKKIFQISKLAEIDPALALAISDIESKHGLFQKSPTGARGIFQMTTIAMKDLLLAMESKSDDIIDIFCGIAFLRLLSTRWKDDEQKTIEKFCSPADRSWYVPKVLELADQYRREIIDKYCP